ncbi:Uncharacterized protein TCAP_04524 [Tolypocladium capitatum]|uniref:Calcineurin-like phosphoesterase domain-containing protein n=1 Tax=Tolypocladium capitatum TaxID=45235 RepID=A0A2K3QDC5_9HYPO|nr:Uncharacterized protein TCAP_04524 [Tolypocladium capitatum]
MRRLVTGLFPSNKDPEPPSAASARRRPQPHPRHRRQRQHRHARPCIPLQVMSDLHLEVGQQYAGFDFPVAAPYLVLAGDVGCLADHDAHLGFLRRRTKRYTRVFLVLGSHEFYGPDFATGLGIAQRMEDEPSLGGRLCLLQQTRVDVGAPAEARHVVASKVADFRKIKDWIVEDHNGARRSDVQGRAANAAIGRRRYPPSAVGPGHVDAGAPPGPLGLRARDGRPGRGQVASGRVVDIRPHAPLVRLRGRRRPRRRRPTRQQAPRPRTPDARRRGKRDDAFDAAKAVRVPVK